MDLGGGFGVAPVPESPRQDHQMSDEKPKSPKPLLIHCNAGRGDVVLHPKDEDDLLRKMDTLAKKYQPIVRMNYSADVVREGEGRLVAGMGHRQWMLSYFPEDDRPVKNSLGD